MLFPITRLHLALPYFTCLTLDLPHHLPASRSSPSLTCLSVFSITYISVSLLYHLPLSRPLPITCLSFFSPATCVSLLSSPLLITCLSLLSSSLACLSSPSRLHVSLLGVCQCAAGVRSAVRTYVTARYSQKIMKGALTYPAPVVRMYRIWITHLHSRVHAAWLGFAFSTHSTPP